MNLEKSRGEHVNIVLANRRWAGIPIVISPSALIILAHGRRNSVRLC